MTEVTITKEGNELAASREAENLLQQAEALLIELTQDHWNVVVCLNRPEDEWASYWLETRACYDNMLESLRSLRDAATKARKVAEAHRSKEHADAFEAALYQLHPPEQF